MTPSFYSEDEIQRRAKALAHEIADERIAKMTADDDDYPRQMTTVEKFANNMLTIVIARAAMIVTPFLIAFFAWAAIGLWNQLDARLATVEAGIAAHKEKIQDIDSRIEFGTTQREDFQKSATDQFKEINSALKELSGQIGTVNGSIIRMQTTIENRLPPRSNTSAEP